MLFGRRSEKLVRLYQLQLVQEELQADEAELPPADVPAARVRSPLGRTASKSWSSPSLWLFAAPDPSHSLLQIGSAAVKWKTPAQRRLDFLPDLTGMMSIKPVIDIIFGTPPPCGGRNMTADDSSITPFVKPIIRRFFTHISPSR